MLKEKYYSIGDTSSLCRIPVKTLRYYYKINVLVPSLRKENSHYRYYSKEQLRAVFIIKRLRFLGFSLSEIKEILRENKLDYMEDILKIRLNRLQAEMEELKRKHNEAEIFLRNILSGKKYFSIDSDPEERITIEKRPEIFLYSRRKIMYSYRNEDVNLENWIQIIEDVRNEKLSVCGSIFVTYNSEIFGQFFQKDCEVEFAIQVENKCKDMDNVHKFGGFEAATLVHAGDYKDIFKSYLALKRWIDRKGYSIAGHSTEEFIVSPVDIGNNMMHITKIIIPVKKQ